VNTTQPERLKDQGKIIHLRKMLKTRIILSLWMQRS